jgi:hypothetical protein
MIRKLKMFGIALTVSCAIGAVASSAAMAQGKLTSDGPVFLTGTEAAGGTVFSYPGLPSTVCNQSHFKAGAVGATPHKGISSGATQFTMVPSLTKCTHGPFPVTVKMTSCDWKYTLGGTISADTYALSTSWECSVPGDAVHLELFSDANHTNQICAYTFAGQTPTSHLHATDTTTGKIRIHGKLTNLHVTKSGAGCGGAGTTNAATFALDIELAGQNVEEASTSVSISD